MTPQELKNSILQLAIQGKLVEQRAEEGTGKELLEKILAAKNAKDAKGKGEKSHAKSAKSAKVGSCVSREEIPDDEKPFDIPESWEWVHINQIAETSLGKTMDKAKNTGDLCPYLCSINVYWDGISLEKVKEARFSADDKAKYFLRKGDLLICEGGDVGRSAIWNLDKEMYYQNALHRVRFHGNILPTYFKLIIECYKGLGIIDRYCKGVTIKHLVQNSLHAIWFPLPPLAEQKRIVAKIEELLPLVDRYEKAWSRLEDFNKRFPADMQKSLLQLAIQGKLVEQRAEEGSGAELLEKILAAKNAEGAKGKGEKSHAKSAKSAKVGSCVSREEILDDEKPFDIPESWEWARLGDIATVLGGKRIPAGRQLTTENTGHIYIRVSDMKNDGVSMEHLMYVPSDIYPSISRYIITKEDVYITVAGTIGRVGKIPPELDGANLTENADRLVFKRINQEWLIQCLKTVVVQNQILDCTTKVGQPKLAIKRIQELIIPLPPLAEQKRIVAKLEELLPLCERLKSESNSAANS